MFEIKAEIDPEATREDLLDVDDSVIEAAEHFFENADVSDGLSLSVERGVFVFSDREPVPFKNYKSKVSAAYQSPDGDRWFVTVDGGHANVSRLVRLLKEAIEDARS